MRKSSSRLLAYCLLSVATLAGARAEDLIRRDYVSQLNDVEKKVTSLAEAIPAEKYSWRPGEGVRSISEVFVHIAGANYMLTSRFLSAKLPDTFKPSRTMEKDITDKAKVIELLHNAFAYARDTASKMSEADLQKPVKTFSGETNGDGALFFMANHLHEHLGQLIAYARTNGVTPPWSQK